MTAQYPPMGWNSWDCYGAAVNEEQVRANADYMASHLKKYGWEYVVVDIQWARPNAENFEYEPFSELCMDEYGRLIPAENRFPSAAGGAGFRPLGDYIHSLGLKFGIHIMRGLPRAAAHKKLPVEGSEYFCHQAASAYSVCEWNPDMYGLRCDDPAALAYYRSIFRLYASWGVDFIKCDDIARRYPECEKEIELISRARSECGRDMVLSLSPGPAPLDRAEHLKKYANMWRITDDFWDDWKLLKSMFERAEKWCIHAGAGHWPDADMLPLGALRQCSSGESRTAFTREEQRTMMSLWCMMRSPLMIGAEMTRNDDFTLSLLTNEELLRIEKESWCAHPLKTTEEESVWVAPHRDGDGYWCALFNLSDAEREIRICGRELERNWTEAKEIWSGKMLRGGGDLSAALRPHDAAVFYLR